MRVSAAEALIGQVAEGFIGSTALPRCHGADSM
jgi:hypothetical protein